MTVAAEGKLEHFDARVASPSEQPVLADVEVGGRAVVTGVRCARRVAIRLMEMGLLPGTPVTVVRIAPLGDPMELQLRGYALSIRRVDARAIDVAPAEESR